MSLVITEVRVDPVSGDERLLGYANIVFDDEFAVHKIRIVRGNAGIIIAMPNQKMGDEHQDLAHPITRDCRRRIQEAIVEEYNRRVKESDRIRDEDIGYK